MRTGKKHLIGLVVLAGVVLVPTAQAASGSPDNRAYYRGSSAAFAPANISPDDRAFSRGTAQIVDRKVIVSPDDRGFARSTPAEPTPTPVSVVLPTHGFNWGDALIGGSVGLVFALLGAGTLAIGLRHRRSALRTA